MGGGGSAASPEVLMEGGGSAAAPHELTGVGGSATTPEASTERGGSVAAPSEIRETSPLPGSRGQAQSSPAQTSQGRGLGVRPQNVPAAQRLQGRSLIPLFSPLFIFLF